MPSSPPLATASSMSLPAAAPTTSVFSFSPVNMISAVKQRSAFAPVLRPPTSPPQACPRAHGEGLPGRKGPGGAAGQGGTAPSIPPQCLMLADQLFLEDGEQGALQESREVPLAPTPLASQPGVITTLDALS
ncbi:hypothetical protein P7K49_009459 [Saguinus oedipus]|uniref:Uncharacterized protein n=1 Tax=Saguinus oedipus TaxID=9490 RepID=A0ABQ9VK20_SAGOE|nr:hypothetical protein P7K49_009459 [Saguinus oedipus]